MGIDGKLNTKRKEIIGKINCLSATVFTTGKSLGSNPEL